MSVRSILITRCIKWGPILIGAMVGPLILLSLGVLFFIFLDLIGGDLEGKDLSVILLGSCFMCGGLYIYGMSAWVLMRGHNNARTYVVVVLLQAVYIPLFVFMPMLYLLISFLAVILACWREWHNCGKGKPA